MFNVEGWGLYYVFCWLLCIYCKLPWGSQQDTKGRLSDTTNKINTLYYSILFKSYILRKGESVLY